MHPTNTRQTTQALNTANAAPAPVVTTGQRLLLFVLFAALALAISGPAAADKRHDHRHGHSHNQHYSKHYSHPVHKVHPRYTKGPKHHDKHYVKHHNPAPKHQAPRQGFSLNIWGISPLLSNHNQHLSTSFHYHGHERCYHRH